MKPLVGSGPVASSPPVSQATARSVVTWDLDPQDYCCEHEQATRSNIAQRLAVLKGCAFDGAYDARHSYATPPYFVPSDTVTDPALARAMGIAGVDDLFGGVVSHPFLATKIITHPLVDADASRPTGWCTRFAAEISAATLPGFSCFSREEARKAGRKLLQSGAAVRVKPSGATGGRGQVVARDVHALDRCLDAMDRAALAVHGVVLEENLERPMTFSVGQVTVAQMLVSYYGRQRLTRDNVGEEVYGGSDLNVVRGGFEALLAADLAPRLRHAIEQARRYHGAVIDCYPDFFASRVNYDVAQGIGSRSAWRSGVLEQSWRAGGATGAELRALESFRRHPERARVRTSSFEVYGPAAVPAEAIVSYHGVDSQVGPIAKYALLIHDADSLQCR